MFLKYHLMYIGIHLCMCVVIHILCLSLMFYSAHTIENPYLQ